MEQLRGTPGPAFGPPPLPAPQRPHFANGLWLMANGSLILRLRRRLSPAFKLNLTRPSEFFSFFSFSGCFSIKFNFVSIRINVPKLKRLMRNQHRPAPPDADEQTQRNKVRQQAAPPRAHERQRHPRDRHHPD